MRKISHTNLQIHVTHTGYHTTIKSTPTVLKKRCEETQMEVDETTSSSASSRPPIPLRQAAKSKDHTSPGQADEAGMRLWLMRY